MARKTTKGRQEHPEGGVMSVGSLERQQIRERREKLGMRQEDLAAKVGVVAATISNLEGGRSKQVKRVVYAAVIRALKIAEGTATSSDSIEDNYRRIVDGASHLNEAALAAVAALIETLRKSG